MTRITFSISEELAVAAEQKARSDKRSLSAHISMLVEQDARQAGLIAPAPNEADEHAELIAAAKIAGMKPALKAVRREAAKTVKAAKATKTRKST